MKQSLLTACKGAAMGLAEAVPGVSGGTIAFITGIYERLLKAIEAFGPGLISVFDSNGRRGVWSRIDGPFLCALAVGMIGGLVGGIFGVTYLLEHYPLLVRGLFFGLILASVYIVGRQIIQRNWKIVAAILCAACAAYWITLAVPVQGSESLPYVFICGVIAISALMLPGLSGSFVLLVLGMYQFMLHDTIKIGVLEQGESAAYLILIVFACGCLVGVMSFSRVLSWLFRHYHDLTLAVLTGCMIGSLNKVRPWQEVLLTRIDSHGEEVAVLSRSVMPDAFVQLDSSVTLYGQDPQTMRVVICMVVGCVGVALLDRYSKPRAINTK